MLMLGYAAGTLGGFVFLSHQVGSFLGVWLGGTLYDRTGSYDVVWWIAIALGVVLAAEGYPETVRKGDPIEGLEAAARLVLDHAGGPAITGGAARRGRSRRRHHPARRDDRRWRGG